MSPHFIHRRALLSAAFATFACRASRGPDAVREVRRSWRLAGVTLHTVTLGEARSPVRYVLHGGPGLDHTYLRPWLDPLAHRAALVYVDLRGHGRSSPPPDAAGYTISSAADDLAALAEARRDPPVDVIAHDFGAAVALAFAARHPGAVHRLVLVSPLRDATQVRAIANRSRAALGDAGWREVQALTTAQGTLRDARSLPTLFRRLGPMWWHRTPPVSVTDAMARHMVYRPESDANFLQSLLRWDARLVAPEVRASVTVIAGDSDRTCTPHESRALADALPHGSFAHLTEAGHLPFIERPEAFRRVVDGALPR